MWVLTVKHNPDGSVLRHKARYVVMGFSQRPGFDYNETYAPTFRQASLRLVAAMAGNTFAPAGGMTYLQLPLRR